MNLFDDIYSFLNYEERPKDRYKCYQLDGSYLGQTEFLDDALDIVECAIITNNLRGCGWIRVLHEPIDKYVETVEEALEHVNFNARFDLCTISQAREVLKILIEQQRGDTDGIF